MGRTRNLLDRMFPSARQDPAALSMDDWASMFTFNGLQYGLSGTPSMTMGQKLEEIDPSFLSYVQQIYKNNGIVFACMAVRQLLFSEARFQYQQLQGGRLGDLFGTKDLAPLENPWPGGTTGDLLSRAINDADLAGNFFAVKQGNRITRMRPDWVTIILGTRDRRGDIGDLDTELAGYLYHPGGPNSGRDPVNLLPGQVCHFAPHQDPVAWYRGMSWLTPIIRDILGDGAASTHKNSYFENGATPNLVISLDPNISAERFKEWVAEFKLEHEGAAKAYRTLFLGGGSDAKVIGNDLKQVDFTEVQSAGETRIAAAAGVPPIIAGFSHGLDSATYSNYGQARRRFADGTMRPLWRIFCGSMANIINVPSGAQLWYDDRNIPFLAEDVKDRAEVLGTKAAAIKSLTEAGYEWASVVDAVEADDLKRLKHTGLLSVQMQPPGNQLGPPNGNGAGAPAPASPKQGSQ